MLTHHGKSNFCNSLRPLVCNDLGSTSAITNYLEYLFMQSLLNAFHDLHILVIGDIMLDRYIVGSVSRISPEAPVPVVEVQERNDHLGAAGNVAANLRSLGAKCSLLGTVGEDDAGERVKELLTSQVIDFYTSPLKKGCCTIVKERIIGNHQQLCRLDQEHQPYCYYIHSQASISWIRERLEGLDGIIFSDYAKGVLSSKFVADVQSMARLKGIFVAMDPKPKSQLQFSGLDLITPNYKEACILAEVDSGLNDKPSMELICKNLYERYQTKNLVITLGENGMQIGRREKMGKRLCISAQQVYDVSGAGDTAIAALSLALCAGASLEDAVLLANTSASIVVGQIGTAQPTQQAIINRLKQESLL